ncbi:MAG: prevent-host-death family protein [Granulosicoccus sp.]|jgi:prevent-host-death family protein
MKTMTSTEARQKFSSVIHSVEHQPVTIVKHHRGIAVLLSSDRYQELKRIGDILYGKPAELAIQKGFVSSKKADALLDSI